MISSPIGVGWSNTKPKSAWRLSRRTALAPLGACSSPVVNNSSTPTGGRSRTRRLAAPRTVATAALLSAPTIASFRFRSRPFSRTTSTGASRGTVSRCAQSSTVRAPSGPRMRASRLPESEPVSAPVSSSSTSRPSSRRSAVTASAIARSRPEGLSISQNRTKSSSRRSRSAGEARPLLSRLDLGGAYVRLDLGHPLEGALVCRSYELPEERLRAQRAGLELRVELGGDEERMAGQLDHLHQPLVGRGAGAHQPGVLEALAQVVVHLVAVAVALVDDCLAVDLAGAGALVELDRIGPQSHGAAHVPHFLLLGQQVDDRERRLGVELGGVGPLHAGHVASEVGHGDLHTQAD